jgi:hypothetical protein
MKPHGKMLVDTPDRIPSTTEDQEHFGRTNPKLIDDEIIGDRQQ